MALSDCEKCWDTPCVCGHEYNDWPSAKLKEFIVMLNGVLEKKLASDDEVIVTPEWAASVLPEGWFMVSDNGWWRLYTAKRDRLVVAGTAGKITRRYFRKLCVQQRIQLNEGAKP